MAIKRFCDRCGRQISDDELSMVVPEYIPTISSYLRLDKDICAKCMSEFVSNFWKRVPIDHLTDVSKPKKKKTEKVDGRFLC